MAALRQAGELGGLRHRRVETAQLVDQPELEGVLSGPDATLGDGVDLPQAAGLSSSSAVGSAYR